MSARLGFIMLVHTALERAAQTAAIVAVLATAICMALYVTPGHAHAAAADADASTLAAAQDAPPPAAMSMFTAPGRISSMTWMAEFLTDTITTTDGWFFALHEAQTARRGYSSQAMTLWNRDGDPILIGRQTIAVFG
jgi:hypothetical protein